MEGPYGEMLALFTTAAAGGAGVSTRGTTDGAGTGIIPAGGAGIGEGTGGAVIPKRSLWREPRSIPCFCRIASLIFEIQGNNSLSVEIPMHISILFIPSSNLQLRVEFNA